MPLISNDSRTPVGPVEPYPDAEAMALEEADGEVEADDGRMSPEDVHSILKRQIDHARKFFEDNVHPDLEEANRFYLGEEFGDEVEGRSRVVSSDIRDTTRFQLTSIMRILFGADKVVEFVPRRLDAIPMAEQATDGVDYVIREDNPGYLVVRSAVQDALTRRIGYVKWFWEENSRVEEYQFRNLMEDQLALLSQSPDVDLIPESKTYRYEQDPVNGQLLKLCDVRVRRVVRDGKAKIEAVPPEEIYYTPEARSFDRAAVVFHSREATVDELVALGIDPEIVEANRGSQNLQDRDQLDVFDARRIEGPDDAGDGRDEADVSQQPVLFTEAYSRIDVDGDGDGELRVFWCVGPGHTIVNGGGYGEIIDDIPIAEFVASPEPHMIVGLSNYDDLRDIQRVKSQVLRGTLDSLAEAINPSTVVVESRVNIKDVQRADTSRVIRVSNDPKDVQEFKHTFVGSDTLPFLQYYDDEVKASRTGVSKEATGLDSDSLQSATKMAVASALTKPQQRLEDIARALAEGGMRKLFKGLLKLLNANQSGPRMMRLRGKYTEVDPRVWDASMDVRVNVALGFGAPEERIRTLMMIAEDQQALHAAGVPFVSFVEMRKVREKLAQLTGVDLVEQYYKPWGDEEQMTFEQMQAANPPPPAPEEILAQVEQSRVQLQAEKQAFEAEFKMLELDFKKDELARKTALEEAKLEIENATKVGIERIRAAAAADRAAQDGGSTGETAA